ncbi:TPA: hypothetical protein ACTW7G_003583 [Klebsiella pneumoniae]
MTDITELAQSEINDALAQLKQISEYPTPSTQYARVLRKYILALVEALEKAQRMESYWRTQCRGITDHCEELQARIAELESHTVKPPVHPTVASENLDDETLQELIEFRRTTFEYHSKEGNKVQTIIHGVTLAALRELQERRKADSEPVAWTDEQELRDVDRGGCGYLFTVNPVTPHADERRIILLYRHAQPAPVVPVTDAMAYAFHHALTDSPLGDDDVEDIKAGLRAALVNVFNTQPAPQEVHDEK